MAVSQSLAVTQVSQDITNNKSNIKIVWKSTQTGESHNNNEKTAYYYVSVNGGTETKYSVKYTLPKGSTKTIVNVTIPVSHDDAGECTVKVRTWMATGISAGTVKKSKTLTLDTIPRKSSLSVAAGTLSTAQTLKVTQKSSGFTHTITAACGNNAVTICTKSKELSFSFRPPIDWASVNAKGKTVEVTYTITTYNGSSSIGSNVYKVNCTIPSNLASPTLEVDVTDTTGAFAKYGKYIQGQSILEIVATAAGLYGATITSYKTTVDGGTYTSATAITPVLKGSGTLSLSCVITDSRGYTNTVNLTLTALAYTAPKITALTVKRCDADGTRNDSGDYLWVAFNGEVTPLENNNTVRVTVQHKKTADANYTSKEVTAYNDVYTIINGSYIFEADKKSTYDVTLIIEDSFGYIDRYTTGASESVWRSRLWRGLGIAFGKFAELEGYLDSGWRIFARKGLRFPLILSGADFNDMVETGTYPCGKQSEYKYLNCPNVGEVSFVLEVAEAGPDGEMLQRLTTNDKERPMVYERHYCDEAWGEWICVAGDYVVASGTSGNWTYRKWASGTYECWGRITSTIASAGSLLSGYVCYGSVSFPTVFISTPVVKYSIYGNTGYEFAGKANVGTGSFTWYVLSNAQYTAGNTVVINAHVIGKWK